MKPIFLLTFLFCCIHFCSQAQNEKKDNPTYKTGIGFRFSPFGVSFKSNSSNKNRSFEIIGYFKDGFIASALYYWNYNLNQPGNIKLYAGGGAQLGVKSENIGGGAVFGVGGIIGADYKFLKLPINLSLDWQPSFQFGKSTDFKGYGGIAARFTL